MSRGLSKFNRIAADAIVAAILVGLAWHSSQRDAAISVGHQASPVDDQRRGVVVHRSRLLMGTELTLTIWTPTERAPDATQSLLEALDQLAVLEQQISSWVPSSETSAVNRAAGETAVQISPQLRDLVAISLEWFHRTQGAFDVTGGPLFDLWARARQQGVLPTVAEIDAARLRIGQDRLVLDADMVKLKDRKMKMSFGAIGKGYAADRAAAFLRHRGFVNFIIDVGGDTLISGRRGDEDWQIAIRHPRHEGLLTVFAATDCAIATSGDYEQYMMVDGKRYGHIIDPRTGWPAQELASVTVISGPAIDASRRATDADALATALTVMESKRALEFVNEADGFEAILVDQHGQVALSAGLHHIGNRLEIVR